MERYNMLIVEEESPGLKVIQTAAYVRLISKNPGLQHENCGDFYSHIAVDGLAQAVYKALDKEFLGHKLNQEMVIVDALEFDSMQIDVEKGYLISETHGIRIYAPKLHLPHATGPRLSPSLVYGMGGALAVEDLFCEEMSGSLQMSLEKLAGELKSLL